MVPQGELSAVVLAAGASVRMNRCKALLPWNSTTLLEHSLHCYLSSAIPRVILVVGGRWEIDIRAAVASIPGVTVVANPDPDRGMFSSLQVGLTTAMRPEVESVIFAPVDVPLAGPQTVATLIAGRSDDAEVHVASFDGKEGHPVMVSAGVAKALIDAPVGETARALMAGFTLARVPVQDPGVCTNLNTPEAVAHWKQKRGV